MLIECNCSGKNIQLACNESKNGINIFAKSTRCLGCQGQAHTNKTTPEQVRINKNDMTRLLTLTNMWPGSQSRYEHVTRLTVTYVRTSRDQAHSRGIAIITRWPGTAWQPPTTGRAQPYNMFTLGQAHSRTKQVTRLTVTYQYNRQSTIRTCQRAWHQLPWKYHGCSQ